MIVVDHDFLNKYVEAYLQVRLSLTAGMGQADLSAKINDLDILWSELTTEQRKIVLNLLMVNR